MALRAGTVFHGTVGQPTAQVIDGSLRFNGVNQHLTKTFGSGGNRRTFTLSYWIKEHGKGSSPTNNPHILWSGTAVETRGGMVHRGSSGTDSGRIYMFNQVSNSTNSAVWTDSKHRDFSAWKHVVFKVDSTQGTGTNRVKIYINGVEQDDEYKTTPAQNLDFQININQEHRIGRGIPDDYGNFSLSQYYFIDGQALGPEYFAFTDPLTNTWRPKKYTGTFGTTGFWLPFDGNSPIGQDKSGNGNDWTTQNFSNTSVDPDILKDSPSGAVFGGRGQTGITTTSSAPANYATLNPLNINDMGGTTSVTISDGNLTVANARNTYFGTALSTLSMTSGKYYCEATVDSNDATTLLCGILKIDPLESRWNTDDEQIGYFQYGYGYRSNNGNKENNLTNASYGDSYGNGDTIGIALDLDAKTISFYKNGTGQGVAYSGIPAGQYAFGFSSSETNNKWKANFGQKPFKYAPPQGYLPLNSATARPETVISRPDQYVGIVTYVGDDATTHPITGLNFGAVPDFVWIKNRNQSEKHILHDTVRGVGDTLYSTSNDHDTGSTYSDRYKSFDLNGFTVGSTHTSTNSDGDDFSAVCWKAGGSSNTFNVDGVGYASAADAGLDGGDLTVTGASVGTKQGFSIIKYQGSGTGGDQVPHGLSQTPNLAFVKQAGNSGSGTPWDVYHSGYYAAGSKNYLRLNNDDGAGYASDMFQTPTSSFMTFGSSNSQNGSSYNYIMYCWHDVPGLQKFGSYRGNGSDDGPFIETGFRPTLIWTRPHTGSGITNNAGWFIYDTLDDSNPYNDDSAVNKPGNYVTYANLLNPLNSHASMGIDILSNGFRLRADSNAYSNYDGWDYIYGAFAAAPVSNLYGGQSNAR